VLKQVAKTKINRDWSKVQPHQVNTGKITTRNYANKNPGKVEWVKSKK